MDGYNFTNRTRRALQAAGDEAAALRHEYIGAEHLLLAVIQDQQSVAVALLTKLGCDLDGIRAMIEATVKPGIAAPPAGVPRPYTSRAMKVLKLAMIAARDDDRSAVGTQHLLLGLIGEEKGIGAQVLAQAGITLSRATAALGSIVADDEGAC